MSSRLPRPSSFPYLKVRWCPSELSLTAKLSSFCPQKKKLPSCSLTCVPLVTSILISSSSPTGSWNLIKHYLVGVVALSKNISTRTLPHCLGSCGLLRIAPLSSFSASWPALTEMANGFSLVGGQAVLIKLLSLNTFNLADSVTTLAAWF